MWGQGPDARAVGTARCLPAELCCESPDPGPWIREEDLDVRWSRSGRALLESETFTKNGFQDAPGPSRLRVLRE